MPETLTVRKVRSRPAPHRNAPRSDITTIMKAEPGTVFEVKFDTERTRLRFINALHARSARARRSAHAVRVAEGIMRVWID